jgi:hypothetical protein
MISKLSVTVYFFLALYGSTTIQTQSFLKIIENFLWFPKQYSYCWIQIFFLYIGIGIWRGWRTDKNSTWTPWFSFLRENSTCFHIPDRGFLFLRNTLLLYSLSPYSQTESHTEKQIHSLRVGWRNLFTSCAVVSVFVLAGNRFWFYILLMYLEYHTVVLLC